jgi:eukaryotic-like serine/threonine-protein kinase
VAVTQVANVFSNRYEIQRGIARGGMAQVYLARDQLLDRPVAVKALFPEFARDPSFVERFRREAQAAANLNHPNIVAIYDWGQERGTYFIVMEYVEGRSLRDVIRADGPVPAAQAAEIGAEIAGALAFAHRNGVVHRDIKPGNVLINDAGRVKVADFGIARATQGNTGEALTQTGAVMGTATYFSPEQAQGLPVDGRSDVYSLGVVLYEMVTGEPPFAGDTPVAVAYKHVREAPAPPRERAPGLPPDLETIILTALSKDLDGRYQSADDLRDDLVGFGKGRPPAAAPVTAMVAEATGPATVAAGRTEAMPVATATAPPREDELERRRRPGAIAGVLVVLALVAGIVAAFLLLLPGDEGGGSAPTIAVPGVVGQPFAEAEAMLRDKGFKVRRVDVQDTHPPDVVRRQSPASGRKLEKGKTVTLQVSGATFAMPNLVGAQRAEAETRLRSEGLQNPADIRVTEEDSDQPPGTVLRTNPPADADVAKTGQAVELFVAREPVVTIPDVANIPANDARALLEGSGLQVSLRNEPNDVIAAGRATRTDPPANGQAKRGDAITLFVSTGPEMVEVPDTRGQPQDQATSTLTFVGFNVVVEFETSDPDDNGIVVDQAPAGGQARRGERVTITVGQFP